MKQSTHWENAIKSAKHGELDEHAERVKKLVLDLQSAAYGSARTYTTVVIFGGYAGLFTVWNLSREVMETSTATWVALLASLSLLSFVMFEVYSMISRALQIRSFAALLTKNLQPDEFLAEHEKLNRHQQFKAFKIEIPLWAVSVTISVITAFAAALILIFVFVCALLKGG
jgi:hypothetical protein